MNGKYGSNLRILFFGHTFLEMSPSVRLLKALEQKEQYYVEMLAKKSTCEKAKIIKPSFIDRFITYRFIKYYFKFKFWNKYKKRKPLPWTFNLMVKNHLKNKIIKKYDIIHLDWIANGTVNLNKLKKIHKPVIWTLHDVWPLTGGCHCNLGCDKWISGCGKCPQLNSNNSKDISSKFWKQKERAFNAIPDLTIITPSNWLEKMAKKSSFFKDRSIYKIPNCLNTELFKPKDKNISRRNFKIPINTYVIIFGAANPVKNLYKGFDLLLEILQKLKNKSKENFHLVIFGTFQAEMKNYHFPFPYTCLNEIKSESKLADAYNCADIFTGPSRQDNFPSTFLEAGSCGLPCVGFEIGGIPEIIDHKKTGYIAKPFDTDDFTNGILWILENEERYNEIKYNAREKIIKNYSQDIVMEKYIQVYNEKLN